MISEKVAIHLTNLEVRVDYPCEETLIWFPFNSFEDPAAGPVISPVTREITLNTTGDEDVKDYLPYDLLIHSKHGKPF